MAQCHPGSVKVLEDCLESIPHLNKERALEVACGDARLTSDLLSRWFTKVDLFDQCPEAVDIARGLKETISNIDRVEQVKMQNFFFTRKYSVIVMRWVTGYLMNDQLIMFLRRAKKALKSWEKTETYPNGSASFILVMDNLSDEGEDYTTPENQRVRTRRNLESLFGQAGLSRIKQMPPKALVKGFEETTTWVLA